MRFTVRLTEAGQTAEVVDWVAKEAQRKAIAKLAKMIGRAPSREAVMEVSEGFPGGDLYSLETATEYLIGRFGPISQSTVKNYAKAWEDGKRGPGCLRSRMVGGLRVFMQMDLDELTRPSRGRPEGEN